MGALSGMSAVDIAIWLGVKNGDEAEKAFKSFGNAGKASLKEVKEAAATLSPELIALSRGVATLKQGMTDLAAQSGSIGNILASFGPGAIAVTAVGVAVGLAGKYMVDATLGAMKFADGISDAAERAKVSTDTLQELRYAIHASGGEYEDADAAILSFRQQLGLAEAGVTKSLQSFQRLGFTQDQLKGFKTFDEALNAVIGKLANLSDENERMGIAAKVGLGQIEPLARKGADEVIRLRQEAHELGFVMDAGMIKSLGEANDKFEDLAKIIDVEFKQAFIDLAPVLVDTMKLIAQLAKGFDEMVEAFDKVGDRSTRALQDEQGRLLGQIVKLRVTQPARGVQQQQNLAMYEKSYAENQAELNRRTAAKANDPRTNTGNGQLIDPKAGAKAEEAAALARARQQKTDDAIKAAQEAEIAARLGVNATIEQQMQAELDKLDIEQVARHKQLAAMTEGDAKHQQLTKAQADQVRAVEDEARDAKRRQLQSKEEAALSARWLKDEQDLATVTSQLLQLQSGQARTAKERRDIELKLLAISQATARAQLEDELSKRDDLSGAQKDARRDRLATVQGAQLQQTLKATQGPLEQFRDTFLKTSGEIDEALQNIAVDGLKSLNDGLVDSIMQAKSLGDVFGNVANTIVSGLMRIAIQQSVIKPFADALMGSASNDNGIWGQIAGAAGRVLGAGLGGGAGAGAGAAVGFGSAGDALGGSGSVGLGTGRAGGGPVYKGDRRPWQEAGMEILSPSSDGYVTDAATLQRRMTDARAPSYDTDRGGSGGPIQVSMTNTSATQLGAKATETPLPGGGRRLDLELWDMAETAADKRMRDMTSGRRDDQALRANFGMTRRVSGS